MSNATQTLDYHNLEDFIGREIALSGWSRINQAEANSFADVTRDPDPMHVDPAWAEVHSPYHETVAAGLHMMSLLPALTRGDRLIITGTRLAMNYGFNKIRFIAPLPIGSAFRNRVTLAEVDRSRGDATKIVTLNQFEIEGASGPVMAAEWVNLLWPMRT